MAERVVNPANLSLIATRLDWSAFLSTWPDKGSLEQAALDKAVKDRGFILKSVQLRWLLNPALGLPRAPFTVWTRTSRTALTKQNVASMALPAASSKLALAGVPLAIVELQVSLPVGGSVTAAAYTPQGQLLSTATSTTSGNSAVRLTGNQIHTVMISGVGTLTAVLAITVKDFVALPDWKAVEVVGLPVDAGWSGTGYPTGNQGMVPASLTPSDAAFKRLGRGAPPFGWQPTLDNGWSAPTWVGPDLATYVKQLQQLPLPPVQKMLANVAEAGFHKDFTVSMPSSDPAQQGGPPSGSSGSEIAIPALGNLLLATSSDTYASLAAGFGTALSDGATAEMGVDYMVTVPHTWWGVTFDATDFVINPGTSAAPAKPTGLSAAQVAQLPPQTLDGAWTESVVLRWNRTTQSSLSAPRVAGYALARYKPGTNTGTPILNPYPMTTGYAPFIPVSREEDPTRIYFSDGNLAMPSDPNQQTHRYGTAAADLFGRFGAWLSAAYTAGALPVQGPAIQSVQLLVPDEGPGDERDATLQIDFAWNWSWRSPERIELVGDFVDTPPDPAVFSSFRVDNLAASTAMIRIHFGGSDAPVAQVLGSGVDVGCLKLMQLEGAPADPDAPDTRRYRLTVKSYSGQANYKVKVSFAGLNKLAYTVFARGYEHLRPALASAWTKPATGRAFSPVPPEAPIPPEAPLWSSLPDVEGIPRAHLSWSPGSGAIAGYVLYQASETALLQHCGFSAPEQTESLVTRLATLRTLTKNGAPAQLTDLRQVFTRVQDPLISGTELEVKLPRGNQVIQAFVLTAMSPNNVESPWPTHLKHFFAVATPARQVPKPPQLEARADRAAGTVVVRLKPSPGISAARFDLYRARRDDQASRLDHMGPPLTRLTPGEPLPPGWSVLTDGQGEIQEATYTDSGVTPGWNRSWYRAVAWSAPDDWLEGRLQARSDPAAPVSAVLPPLTPPDLTGLAIEETVQVGMTVTAVRLGWTSTAPIHPTALGPHLVRVVVESLGFNAEGRPAGVLARSSSALQQTLALSGPLVQPPPDTVLGPVARDPGAGPAVHYQVWVNYPAGTPAQTRFMVHITLTDPLGRATGQSGEVQW